MSNSKKLRGSAALRETFIAIFAISLSLSACAERQPYERYKTIVDRQMFGPPPEGFDPTKPPSEAVTSRAAEKQAQELSKEQEKLKSAIRFSMINVTPSGETAVGFTDSSDAKSPRHYYLKVGESAGSWTVKEADPSASTMTIIHSDGIEVSLKIGGDSSKSDATKPASAVAPNAGGRRSPFGGSLSAQRARRRAEKDARENAQRAEYDKKLKEQAAAFEKRQQEDRQAREAEKAQQDAEREAQRKQLLQIQEELKRAREEKSKAEESEKAESSNNSEE